MEEIYSPEVVEAMRKAADQAWAKDRQLKAAAPDMAELLLELREALIERHDTVDDLQGNPAPNWAMNLTKSIDEVLKIAGVE